MLDAVELGQLRRSFLQQHFTFQAAAAPRLPLHLGRLGPDRGTHKVPPPHRTDKTGANASQTCKSVQKYQGKKPVSDPAHLQGGSERAALRKRPRHTRN